MQGGHAPRERVSWNDLATTLQRQAIVTLHVSVWVEISTPLIVLGLAKCHAPRERVSWNLCLFSILPPTPVTLHVSVWVEMYKSVGRKRRYSSRSTWACELKFYIKKNLKWRWWSRSTWACELKLEICEKAAKILGHAPRERVSWNVSDIDVESLKVGHAPRERVSWNEVAVKHHISVCSHAPRERVSWNRFISPRQ